MPWIQTANKEDVEQNSALYGWGPHNFSRPDAPATATVPRYLGLQANNNGSFTGIAKGMRLRCGTDSGGGDFAQIEKPQRSPGGKRVSIGSGGINELIVEFELESNAAPFTSDAAIGQTAQNDVDRTKGAFLDLTNEEVNVNGTTQSVSLTETVRAAYIMRIRSDYDAGQTRFQIKGDEGNTDVDVTVSDTIGPMEALAVIRENGADEFFLVRWARESLAEFTF